MTAYRVILTIWHSGESRHAFPGEVVSLDHLPSESVALLVEAGFVEPAGPVATVAVTVVSASAAPPQTFIDTARGPVPADQIGPDISAEMPAPVDPADPKEE